MAIFDDYEFFAPRFEIRVNGRALPPEYAALIASVRVEATQDGADELEIDASAWDGVGQRFRILGEDVLMAGNSCVVWGGYGQNLEPLQRFRLLREEAQYPSGEMARVRIRGYSAVHRLAEAKAARAYEAGATDAQIAQAIAEEAGIGWTTDSIPPTAPLQGPRVKESGASDWDFLVGLAAANEYGPPLVRYDAATDRDILYFRPLSWRVQRERARFVRSPWLAGTDAPAGTLLEFEASLSLAGVPTRVEVVGWDATAQAPIRVAVEIREDGQEPLITDLSGTIREVSDGIRSGSQLYVTVLNAGSDAPESAKAEVIPVYAVRTTEDAVAWAMRWIRTRNQAFLVGRATTIGWPRLWTGQIHEFAGLAPHHNGLWYVESCAHVWDRGGYRCDLDLSRVLDESAAPEEAPP